MNPCVSIIYFQWLSNHGKYCFIHMPHPFLPPHPSQTILKHNIHFLKLTGGNILFLKLGGGGTQMFFLLLFFKLYRYLNCIFVL